MPNGANKNWEYQLVDQTGHYSDAGLRQGYLLSGRRIQRQYHRTGKKTKAKVKATKRKQSSGTGKTVPVLSLDQLFKRFK